MTVFLFWLAGILILIACYLAYLWLHPRKRSRFQVKLTAIFLLFTIIPIIPLVFLVSTLATDTADMLLVPEVEEALLKAIESIKLQFENHAERFVAAADDRNVTIETLAKWQIDYFLIWRKQNDRIELAHSIGRTGEWLERGKSFEAESIGEIWGQKNSQLENISAVNNGAEGLPESHCRVWLPLSANEIAMVGFAISPDIASSKQRLLQTLRVYNSLSLIKERALQNQLIWGMAATFVFVFSLASVLAARGISKRISHPIEELTEVTTQVAAGDLRAQAKINAKDEIGALVDSFNRMIRELNSNREKLIISERLAAWREVARQVSHEIKNPLTPIQLALYRIRQRLDKSLAAQSAIHESFESIDEELNSLRLLAQEFSDFARLPSAELKADSLNDIVQVTTRLYEGTSSNVRIKLDLEANLPERPIDREQIKRLLINLIKNAIEANPNGNCSIKITSRTENARAKIVIIDNGPGLPKEALGKIFQPNYTTKTGGSGLGLVMVKRIVEQHNGEIEVDSTPGEGTVFSILL